MAVKTFTAWRTPAALWQPLDQAVGGFAVDAAADASNHIVPDWYGPGSTIGEDALSLPEWMNPAWCNPPYGRGLEKWLDKFIEQGRMGVNVVALLPAYVDRLWWHEKVVKVGADIIFLVGRVPFERVDEEGNVVTGSQPRDPSALVIYGPTASGRTGWLDWRKKKEENEPSSGGETEAESVAGDSHEDLHGDEADGLVG